MPILIATPVRSARGVGTKAEGILRPSSHMGEYWLRRLPLGQQVHPIEDGEDLPNNLVIRTTVEAQARAAPDVEHKGATTAEQIEIENVQASVGGVDLGCSAVPKYVLGAENDDDLQYKGAE